MENENETEAVVRRFGGPAGFAKALERATGTPQHRQAIWLWMRRNWFPVHRVRTILGMCLADNLPIEHAQLKEARDK